MASGTVDEQSVTGHPADEADEPDEPGRVGRWVRSDPVRAVAAALIVVQLLWRAEITFRGFLWQDDFVFTARAAESGLTAGFLFDTYGGHLIPAEMLLYWLITHAAGLVYWPYALLLLAGQAVLSVAFFRLLRQLVQPGWGLLIPLSLLLFSPLTLEATSWWVFGANMLPMQLAMVWALGAQTRYVRTRRARHVASLSLSVVFGLAFSEKSLFVVPLIFFATACLFVRGGVLRSIARAIRRYWPSWAALGVISLTYLAFFLSRPSPVCGLQGCPPTFRQPSSVGEVITFGQQLVGSTLVPGLLGGPWQWVDVGGGPGLVDSPEVLRWLAWVVFLALVVFTIWLRPAAARAWMLLAIYVAMGVGLLAATRLGAVLSPLAGLVTRYVADMVVVAAICVGVALLGVKDTLPAGPTRARSIRMGVFREPGTVAVGYVLCAAALAALALGTAFSAARFADDWAVQPGRDYLHTAADELATAPADTVFIDRGVPASVVAPFFYPYNLHSRFFRAAKPAPTFVSEAEYPSTFDDSGHIRPARVDGVGIVPGPVHELDCGYLIRDRQAVRIPLEVALVPWPWVIRVGYFSTGDSTARLRLGDAEHEFPVKQGLHQVFFPLEAGGDAVSLSLTGQVVRMCTNEIDIGHLVPQL